MPNPYEVMAAEHIGTAWARQDRLADLIGEAAGTCDLGAGSLRFGDGPSFSVGILGTFDKARSVWIWAWAHTRTKSLGDGVLAAAHALRTFGEDKGMAQFTQAEIPAEEQDCRMLSLLAVGHLDKGAYHRNPHGGEVDYVLIDPVPALTCPTDPPRIPQLISEFSTTGVVARTAVEEFFRAEGYEISGNSNSMTTRNGETAFEVRFTPEGRVANISGDMPATLAEEEHPSLFSRLFGSLSR